MPGSQRVEVSSPESNRLRASRLEPSRPTSGCWPLAGRLLSKTCTWTFSGSWNLHCGMSLAWVKSCVSLSAEPEPEPTSDSPISSSDVVGSLRRARVNCSGMGLVGLAPRFLPCGPCRRSGRCLSDRELVSRVESTKKARPLLTPVLLAAPDVTSFPRKRTPRSSRPRLHAHHTYTCTDILDCMQHNILSCLTSEEAAPEAYVDFPNMYSTGKSGNSLKTRDVGMVTEIQQLDGWLRTTEKVRV